MANQFEDVPGVIFDGLEKTENDQRTSEDQKSDYEMYIFALIEDADDYEESFLAPKREEAEEYYQGIRPYLNSEDTEDDPQESGRSTVVSTTVRDTIMAIMPSLIRIFTSSQHPVEFIPNNKWAVDKAMEQTDYIRHVFYEDNEGFMIIYNILKDSMNKATAVVKWYTDNAPTEIVSNYSNVTSEQIDLLARMEDVADIEIDEVDEDAFDVTVTQVVRQNITRIVSVPPEEFRIDRRAKSIKDARIVGHRRPETISALRLMGYSLEEIKESLKGDNSSVTYNSDERFLRNPALVDDYAPDDEIDFGEYYVKADSDGDGINELHYIHVVGEKIIRDEKVSRVKMAAFCPDPEPHSAIGHSTNEHMQDLQRIKTNVLRSTLDSLAQSIHGRMGVVENMVNMDDVLNDDIGAPIRMKSPTAIVPIPSTYVGQPALEMLSYLDMAGEKRSGISDASKGLDPKALQSTNVNAVDMVIDGAKERIELIARILAETGMKDMFKGLLQEVTENPNKPRTIKIRGDWVEVDPSTFDPSLSVQTNPAIGRGTDMERFQMLQNIKATQEAVIERLGMMNPIVTPQNYLNTVNDMLQIGGIKNVDRYFNTPTEEQLQQLQQSMNKPDPALILAQAETKKAEASTEKIRADTVKTIAANERQDAKDANDDDFRRDKLEAETKVKMAELGLDAFNILAGLELDRKALNNEGPAADTGTGG